MALNLFSGKAFTVVLMLICLGELSDLSEKALAEVAFTTVALTGMPATGAGPGVFYGQVGAFGEPMRNDGGHMAFYATIFGDAVGAGNGLALLAGPSEAPRLVARNGQLAPGTSGNYDDFFFPAPIQKLNNSGRVAFFAELAGVGITSANDQAVFAGPPEAVAVIARTGSSAPGTAPGVHYGIEENQFYNMNFRNLEYNEAGQVSFTADLGGPGVDPFNREAYFAGSPNSVTLVAREGEPVPGLPNGLTYKDLSGSGPQLSDSGHLAFRVSLAGLGVNAANDSAIFVGPPGGLTPIAREGSPAPGTDSGVTYSELCSGICYAPVTFNDDGHVAFYSGLAGVGVTGQNWSAIFAGPPSQLTLIARGGSPAPGTAAEVNYAMLTSPVLNDTGQASFKASLAGPGVTTTNDSAIFAGTPGGLGLIAREGDPAPGTSAGVRLAEGRFGGLFPILNDIGQVAFEADLAGDGVTEMNDEAVFVFDPLVGTIMIVREGELFDVGGGDMRRIRDFGIQSIGNLGNDGVLPVGLVFTDLTYGLFLAAIKPMTETVTGDYNENGVVDAADYVVWRNTFGQTGIDLVADGNGNSEIDAGDYDVWRTHFGETASNSTATNASSNSAFVPEPTGAILLTLTMAGTITLCRHRRLRLAGNLS